MDKKTVLAFVLIGVVIILMPYYYKTVSPDIEEQKPAAQSLKKGERVEEVPASPSASEIQKSAEISETAVKEPAADDIWQAVDDSAVKVIKVETPLYIAKFSSRGARLTSFRLKKYSNRRGGFVEMIGKTSDDGAYPTAYMTFPRIGLSTDELVFTASRDSLQINPGSESEIVFKAVLKNGGTLKKRYKFNGGSYVVELSLESSGINLGDEYYFRWDGGVKVTEPDTVQDLSYSKAFAYMGGELEKFDAPGKGDKRISPSGRVDWIAVRSKYFEIAVIPEGNTAGIDFVGSRVGYGKTAPKEYDLAVKMDNPGSALNQIYTIYIGPIDSKLLAELGVQLQATMDWGWTVIKPFSKFVLWSFKLLHNVIPNYGVVIILFSVLIKIIVWPLTHKSYESMKKMQNLQPMMKEIKEKYKGDPQRIQKETAKLYKDQGVNPMGSCLPTLLQMPLLFALFIVFRSTIELRGEPFILWISDLSLPDTVLHLGFSLPLYGNQVSILPLIMGISTFFQSKSSVSDPSQKMMIYFMPVFLTLIFNSFPSGLTLYYTLFNLLSMVQQKMIQTNNKGKEEVKLPKPGKKK